MREVAEVAGITPARFRAEILPSGRPAVFRGLAAGWPAVRAADPAAYLAQRATDHPCELLVGSPEIAGRFFYDDTLAGLNFVREPGTLRATLDRLAGLTGDAAPPAIALQSVPAAAVPGFAAENRIALLDPLPAPRLWIGNRVVTALHHDAMSNVAVVVAGRRRFTLAPPDQVANLYMGPFEFTPAGTPVSLVDPEAPDLARFPRFAETLDVLETAELGPGDAIYIPYMWWHQVRSLDPLSVLANYWWNEAPAPPPGLAPVDALVHALLALGGLPAEQRAAWRAMLDAVVFGPEPEHVPENRRGIRGRLSPEQRERLRHQLGRVMLSSGPA